MTNLVVVYQNYQNIGDAYLRLVEGNVSTMTDELNSATIFTSITNLAQAVTQAAKDPDLNIITRKMIVYEVKLLKRTLSRSM